MKQLVRFLLLVGFVLAYFWWMVTIAALVVVLRLAWTGYWQAKREFEAERQAQIAECRRLIAAAHRAYTQDTIGYFAPRAPAVTAKPPHHSV